MIRRYLVVRLSILALLVATGLSVAVTSAAAPIAADTIERDSEPVVVQGVFPGVPVEQVFVYIHTGDAWQQVPSQIDEVTAEGIYSANEDGILDANDQVVFMAADLGELATEAPTATLPISDTWYLVEVTDPLSPGSQGWAYIVRSATLSPDDTLEDRVSYDAGTQRINADDYAVGYATDHNGLDYMSLFGGDDILDRTKLRIVLGGLPPITENNFPVVDVELIKDGNVRVITKRGQSVTLAYASLIETTTSFTIPLAIPVTVNQVIISTDLVSGTNGLYFNENTATPVNIDGNPDPVSPTPFTEAWRQISVADGVVVQVVDFSEVNGTPRHYYNDDSTDDQSTGENGLWGDSGFSLFSVQPVGNRVSYTNYQYVAPASSDNLGATLFDQRQAPLKVEVSRKGGQQIFLYVPSTYRN